MPIYKTSKDTIPNWIEVCEKTSTNSNLCEICGKECTDKITRKSYQRYAERRRTNRVRIPAMYFSSASLWLPALEKAGMITWSDKLACSDCNKKFTDILSACSTE